MTTETNTTDLIALTAEVVSAYVANNALQPSDLPGLIASVHEALRAAAEPPAPAAELLVPIVPIKKTVTPDAIISLEDGKPYKSLKRHLTSRGLTPDEYRRKWSLPHDYPMTSEKYKAERSQIAKASGLGRARLRAVA